MEIKVQKNVLGQKESPFAGVAGRVLEKELQSFSQSPQFTLCCFSTNAKMLISLIQRGSTELPEVAKSSLREVKTAALSFTHRETEH